MEPPPPGEFPEEDAPPGTGTMPPETRTDDVAPPQSATGDQYQQQIDHSGYSQFPPGYSDYYSAYYYGAYGEL
jgi:hypothetical protein